MTKISIFHRIFDIAEPHIALGNKNKQLNAKATVSEFFTRHYMYTQTNVTNAQEVIVFRNPDVHGRDSHYSLSNRKTKSAAYYSSLLHF